MEIKQLSSFFFVDRSRSTQFICTLREQQVRVTDVFTITSLALELTFVLYNLMWDDSAYLHVSGTLAVIDKSCL